MCTPLTARAEPLSRPWSARAKCDYRPVHALLDARSHQPDHALVPGAVEQAQAEWQVRIGGIETHALQSLQRFGLHARLNVAALAIKLVQFDGQFLGACWFVAQQALDTQ